jgi:hypothetical protein
MNPTYFDEDTGKQLVKLPDNWMTVPARLRVGTKVKLLSHIALRIGTRGPEFADWDQVVKILETHNGRGQFPPRDITQEDDEDTVWSGQSAGYLVVSLPYPYSYRRRNEDGTYEDGTYKTICSLDEEGTEWEVVK